MASSKTYGLTHLVVAVSNVDRTRQFYQQVFEMEVMYISDAFVQLTTPGCNDILVFEEKTDTRIGTSGGIAHFGFRLRDPKDVDEIICRINAAGGFIISRGEFLPGSPYVFLKTPMGMKLKCGMNFYNKEGQMLVLSSYYLKALTSAKCLCECLQGLN